MRTPDDGRADAATYVGGMDTLLQVEYIMAVESLADNLNRVSRGYSGASVLTCR
jgi:hypothetical protein